MDHTTPRHPRRRVALAAGAVGTALCAALTAGCTSSQPASATAATAPNGPGQWTPVQIADAESVLTGPPAGQGSAEATCLVKYASANLSWQQFQSYVSFLTGSGGIATPSGSQGAVVSRLSNYAVQQCGAQSVNPGFASPTGS